MSVTPSVRPPRPTSVWIVYVILFCQGAAIIGGTLITTLGSDAEVLDTAGTVALTVLYILSGAVLVLLGFRIFLGSATARTPAMVLQLLIVVLSFSFFAGGALATGLIFLLPAATALVLLFVRPTAEWLEAKQD
ncbi:hypothetical protein [Nesterenkonia natronophila]|uniref:Integral membrane protein n=1 Tax=Nesterenkonia natronophila TaxID=2174932 RepID=A0A3A4F1Y0_9MICC|nr:hypothetical protein [Nesterenkonia natronophila]RJN31828.1 hypothetical protein D3250_06820 [Nesterenkonia natronophila]